jgi:hypothetical protein
MYARIVSFTLTGPSHDEYLTNATAMAGEFNTWPGLHAKYWLADRTQRRYGGFYLFENVDAARLSRTTALFDQMMANPAFGDLTIQEFDILDEPTAITTPQLEETFHAHG